MPAREAVAHRRKLRCEPMVTPAEAPGAPFHRRRHSNPCTVFLFKPLRSHAVIARTLKGVRSALRRREPPRALAAPLWHFHCDVARIPD